MDSEEKTNSADFETALLEAGFGRFHCFLLAVCGAIYASCAISTTTLSFVLPVAECEFLLSSADKGRLSAMPLIGMIFGSYLWGAAADYRGRKWVIVASLLTDAFAAVISSFVPNFELFLVCRFLNGFGIIGATSLVFSYLGEFLSIQHRDVMLCRLELFWAIGNVFLPVLAWIVIPNTWRIGTDSQATFSYNSWRIFVAVCGMPSLLTAMLLCLFPESPKFLLVNGKQSNARTVLQTIYAINTGRKKDHYPITSFIGEDMNGNSIFIPSEISFWRRANDQLSNIWKQNQVLFRKPYLRYLLTTCFADFGLMASYYTLVMWFPDIFDRFDQYQALYPSQPMGVCDVTKLDVTTTVNGTKNFDMCAQPIDNRVFIETLAVGLSCIPTAISLGLSINKLGKKFLVVFSLVTSGIAALALMWVKNSNQNLAVSCLFEALTSITETVIFCIVVDLFPTNLRAVALSLTVTSGRIGAVIGNIIFGILIDIHCVIPIYLFGFLLIASGLLCLTIPKSERTIVSSV